MDEVVYVVVALGLLGLLLIMVKTANTVRQVGFLRFSKALGKLVASVAVAGWKLITGMNAQRSPSSRSEPLDLSGTGGHYNARTGNYDNGQDPYGIYPDDNRNL